MGQVLGFSHSRACRNTTMVDVSTSCKVHGILLMFTAEGFESCWAQLHEAIVSGKLEICRQLLTSSMCNTDLCLGALTPAQRLTQLDNIAYSKLKTTSLHMAALYRHPDFLQLLLEHGCETSRMDGFGRTPAAILLEHWPRVTFSGTGNQVPRRSSLKQHNSDTLLLWEVPDGLKGNRYYPIGNQGESCERWLFRQQVIAWKVRAANCLKLLLDYGFDVNAVADRRRSSTLLHIAARYDLADVVQLVMASQTEKEQKHVFTQQIFEARGKSQTYETIGVVHSEDNLGQRQAETGSNKAHLASDLSVSNQVKMTVEHHLRSAVVQPHGYLARWNQNIRNQIYRWSGGNSRKWQRKEKKSELHELPPKTEPVWGNIMEEEYGQTVRHVVDLEVRNATAKTPLAVAIDRGSLNVANCLLSYGSDIFAVDFYGRTVLHFLSERDATFDSFLRDVVERGVDVQSVDNGGNTALHVAAYMGNVSKVRFLLSMGASPDQSNLTEKTPLFLAFQRRDPFAREIILLFLLGSVLVKVRDRLHRTPILLQHAENKACQVELDHLCKTCNTLLHRCVVTVRRTIGLSYLLDSKDLCTLPCPCSVQQTIYGKEERKIVNLLHI